MAVSPNTIGWIILLVAAGFVLVRLVRRNGAKRKAGSDSGGNGSNGDFGEGHGTAAGMVTMVDMLAATVAEMAAAETAAAAMAAGISWGAYS